MASKITERTATFSIKQLEAGFSAEIAGFPFHNYGREDIDRVKAAWKSFPIIRFRGSELNDKDQIRFSKEFGPAVFHPSQMAEGAHPSCPEILVISNARSAEGKLQGALGDGEVNWHTDTPFVEHPPAGAFLHALRIPNGGGDTNFVSMYQAYDTLPTELLRVIDRRAIHHQAIYAANRVLRRGAIDPRTDDIRKWPGVDHPIVRTHGDSGRKCLYLGFRNYAWIVGLPPDESEDVLNRLWAHSTEGNSVWSQVWETGDLLMWDNRCLMHRRDAFDSNSIRVMHRTTSEGERPF